MAIMRRSPRYEQAAALDLRQRGPATRGGTRPTWRREQGPGRWTGLRAPAMERV